MKKPIENGIAEVSGYCNVNFDHSISHNTNGGYGYAYSTVKSSDLTLILKKSAGMKIQYSCKHKPCLSPIPDHYFFSDARYYLLRKVVCTANVEMSLLLHYFIQY